jgi:hypothetical protein
MYKIQNSIFLPSENPAMFILKGVSLSLLNTHLAKAFLLLISFWEEAEVVLKLLLKPKHES